MLTCHEPRDGRWDQGGQQAPFRLHALSGVSNYRFTCRRGGQVSSRNIRRGSDELKRPRDGLQHLPLLLPLLLPIVCSITIVYNVSDGLGSRRDDVTWSLVRFLVLQLALFQSQDPHAMDGLPNHLWTTVMTYVDNTTDVMNLCLSCKSARPLSQDPLSQALWLLRHRPGRALHLAISSNINEVCSLPLVHSLLHLNRNEIHAADCAGEMALHVASRRGLGSADCNPINVADCCIINVADCNTINVADCYIINAADCNPINVADCYIINVADCNTINVTGFRFKLTSLFWEDAVADCAGDMALHVCSHRGLLAQVKTLVTAGAYVDVDNKLGDTPLHEACGHGYTDIVKFLLKAGACREGSAKVASSQGHAAVVKALLEDGAQVNVYGEDGLSPLKLACSFGHAEVVGTLLNAHAPISPPYEGDRCPLHFAAYYGHPLTVLVLLVAGANVDVRDKGNNTPLHDACRAGHLETAKTLVVAGASLSVCNLVGRSPLDEAYMYGHNAIVEFLASRSQ
eukprot:gene4338-14452_t